MNEFDAKDIELPEELDSPPPPRRRFKRADPTERATFCMLAHTGSGGGSTSQHGGAKELPMSWGGLRFSERLDGVEELRRGAEERRVRRGD